MTHDIDEEIDDLMRRRRLMVERFQILSDMRSSPELASDLIQQINRLNERITAVAREAEQGEWLAISSLSVSSR
ncbi:MAG: hypothetical protein AAGB04_23985 [Pseudomonadota bacterium]